MIVCTGAPRSGTSLLMQTLVHLGMKSPAPPFLPEHEKMKEFNPGGFYEFNSADGIRNEAYQGMVIKLFGGQLAQTEKRFISKLIWVRRNREQAIKSYDRIRIHLPYTDVSSEQIYDANYELIQKCVDKKSAMAELEEIKAWPQKFVNDLISYLEIEPNAEQYYNAIKNIRRN